MEDRKTFYLTAGVILKALLGVFKMLNIEQECLYKWIGQPKATLQCICVFSFGDTLTSLHNLVHLREEGKEKKKQSTVALHSEVTAIKAMSFAMGGM